MKSPRGLVFLSLLLFSAFFLFDKVFALHDVKLRVQKDPTYIYYDYKYELLDELEQAHRELQIIRRQDGSQANRKRIAVVMGSSRLLFFDYSNFRRNHPDWDVFNFSVPVNSPAYYAYILERIYERGIRPDALILESDPFQFNEYSPGFRRSNLQYSFDLRFILSHFALFDRDDVSAFLGRWLFAGLKYTPDPDRTVLFVSRRKDPRLPLFTQTEDFTRKNRGCGFSPIPLPGWFEQDFSRLAISAKGTIGWLYAGYRVSERQWAFFEQALKLARDAKTPVLIIRPQVSRPMQRILEHDAAIAGYGRQWRERMDRILSKEVFLDLSRGEPYDCNAFVDGSHMALECYDPVLDEAMKSFEKSTE